MASKVPLHGSGIPHVDTLGVSPWLQWGVIGVILVVGCWLMLDVRGKSATAQRPLDDPADDADGPLVVGRRGAVANGPLTPLAPLPPAAAGGRGEARREGTVVFGQRLALPIWLNPVRVVTAVLGIGAGAQAMDRVREIMELDARLGSQGTFQVSRMAIWLMVLLLLGGALAIPVPNLAAIAFLGAGGLAAFFAIADWWESKLEWWGAEYALTAWSHLWAWAAVGLVLAGLSLLGGWYRPRVRSEK